MKNIALIFVLIICTMPSITAFELICMYNDSDIIGGIKLWSNQTLSVEDEELFLEAVNKIEEFDDCVFINEESIIDDIDGCNFVVQVLNKNIIEKNSKIKLLVLSLIMVLIAIIIDELYSAIKSKKNKDGR